MNPHITIAIIFISWILAYTAGVVSAVIYFRRKERKEQKLKKYFKK